MEALECFVTCGLRAGEGVVLFATARHLQDLQIRLHSSRLQLDRACWEGRYIPVVANEALGTLMVDGWPDAQIFKTLVGACLDRAQAGGREVRAFGEMAAVLVGRAEVDAAVRLEQLWNECCRERKLTLFCAYSSTCFPVNSSGALKAVCHEHDWFLDGHNALKPASMPIATSIPCDDGNDEERLDFFERLGFKFDEAIAIDIKRDEATALAALNAMDASGNAASPFGLSTGSKSAAAWSIPGTRHSDTGTSWVLSPVH